LFIALQKEDISEVIFRYVDSFFAFVAPSTMNTIIIEVGNNIFPIKFLENKAKYLILMNTFT